MRAYGFVLILIAGFSPRFAHATCGDGNLDATEDCDDGNLVAGDGCSDVCATESGWLCTDAEFNLDFSEMFYNDGVHAAPEPNWTLSSDGRTVSQSENSIPGLYVSTLPATGVTATFELTVNTASDDDYIGWAVGYEAGDFYNASAHWILFDWKQMDQTVHCPGFAGLAMYRVEGAFGSNDPWCHNTSATRIAWADTLGGTGWSDFQTYTIEMTYNTNHVLVYVDGVLQFDETGFFPGGTFSFYTNSKEGGIFSLVSPTEGSSVCSEIDSDSDGLSDNMEDGLGMDNTTDDSDSDGLGDFDEVYTYNTDGASADSDGDGLNDYEEVIVYGSDPNDSDSDGDGLSDGDEVAAGTDLFGTDFDGDGYLDGDDNCPTLFNDQSDLDADDLGDLCDSDDDGDGEDAIADGGTDCDDTNELVFAASEEYCDGIDNNCDGSIDDATSVDMIDWYYDGDGDGFGDATISQTQCDAPSGMVSDMTDCDDTAATSYPGADEYCDGIDSDCDGVLDEDDALDAATWYADADADGFGDSETSLLSCEQPEGYVVDMTDCDDTATGSNPDADEIWYDGIDQNCDGLSDYDQDGDGFESTEADGGTDCDDENVDINPDADEIWYDGIDQNCDGLSDYDQDGDGFESTEADGGTDCDDENVDINPDAEEIWYDGIDQNCDGLSDSDQDGDGFDQEEDCDDTDSALYPNADGLDENCQLIGEEDAPKAGCNCSTSGDTPDWKSHAVWMFGMLSLVFLRRRER
ncbi:MAG: MopE-related protein [Myxococcota bacterium]|nr:MopE-related protein [Myxococcota bacterium]